MSYEIHKAVGCGVTGCRLIWVSQKKSRNQGRQEVRQVIWKGNRMDRAALAPGNQPIFFFDGGFKTWAEVERRAQLNWAIATLLARYPVR